MNIDQDAINTLFAGVGILVLVVSPRVKQLIDIVRGSTPLPQWGPSVIALSSGYIFSMAILYLLYSGKGQPFPIVLAALISVFAALASAADALGITVAHDHANDVVGARKKAKLKRGVNT